MVARLTADLCISLSLLSISVSLYSSSAVDSFEFKEADAGAVQIDADLNSWLAQQSTMLEGPASSDEQIARLPKDLDEVSLLVAGLYADRASATGKQKEADTVDRSLAKINEFLGDTQGKGHILYPYLLAELIAEPSIHPRVHNFLVEKLRDMGSASCPREHLILDDLARQKWADIDVRQLRKYIGEISQFQSIPFRRVSLETLLLGTPALLRKDIVEEVRPLLEPFPKLMENHSWVLEPGAQSPAQSLSPKTAAVRNLLLARAAVAHKSCGKARDHFLSALTAGAAQTARTQLELVGMKIEECYHPAGAKARIEFWDSVRDPLVEAMGFAGEEMAMRRIGNIKWGMDLFDDAIAMFEEIRDRAAQEKSPELEGDAVFTLGKIEENRGHLDDAIAYYQQYIEVFSVGNKADEALMGAAILLIEKGEKKPALANVQKIIDKYAKQPAINWDETSLSFALFWAGQLLYDSGDSNGAARMWRRLAGEFYSTYYGAIGHYLIEKIEKKSFQLQPVPSIPFKWSEVYARLGTAERQVIDRVVTLQRLGFRTDALCEMAELPGGGNNYDRDLVIALLRHVMGDWLPAIKKYGELPHSYRNTLPQGMERILFPRAYVAEIEKYAARLAIDPDFVLAIIRQESVFNPRAVSSVGATGLMQLMPATAAREVKRLDSHYLTDEERHKIPRGFAVTNLLYDADLNLSLGVHHVHSLLNQFANPVFMLSAYNANPLALARWSKNIPSNNLLTFVERIPYRETKAYVKLVMRNYFYYKRWYRGSKESLPFLEALLPPSLRKGEEVGEAKGPNKDNPQGG